MVKKKIKIKKNKIKNRKNRNKIKNKIKNIKNKKYHIKNKKIKNKQNIDGETRQSCFKLFYSKTMNKLSQTEMIDCQKKEDIPIRGRKARYKKVKMDKGALRCSFLIRSSSKHRQGVRACIWDYTPLWTPLFKK